MQKIIYYHDTDCGGVVYYANYLKFFEEARTVFFESKGVIMKDLIARGEFFVVARQEVDYKAPTRYGDTIDIEAKIDEVTAVKIIFYHQVKGPKGELCVTAKTTMVYVDKNLKPKAIPQDVKERLV